MKRGIINLPLHGGHAPSYLVKRMIKLSAAISKIIIEDGGTKEFFKRISDPLWFQAFGCVLGFDWHSSGLTTVVTSVLKQSIRYDTHGISLSGGKGKNSTKPKYEIPKLAEQNHNLSTNRINKLLYASKMSAKIDSAAIQDGFNLYHHFILFDDYGDWTIIQQGLNKTYKMARRYHWVSNNFINYIIEPHRGIISNERIPFCLDMTSRESEENRKTCVDIIKEGSNSLKSSIYKIIETNTSQNLDKWLYNNKLPLDSNGFFEKLDTNIEKYEMPRRINWNVMDKLYDIHPKNYEELISQEGIGPSTIRALALIAEIIYGTKASWNDPAKYNYAHGGKDGVPYPIARNTYDNSIKYLSEAINGSEIEKVEKIKSLKRLSVYSNILFNTNDYNYCTK
ncbi:MAG TPA: DUF763 domain-containing protein [Nitrososphaeraceae archaeon]|nr:DUF763 domain-containing protein [Nitrososphaeraceae archaeon]